MESFTVHSGVVAVLDRANIDTDQLIPKQFLKSIQRTGFEDGLFFDWRYRPDGSPDPEFPLNQEAFAGASILVARDNFGCGSSREHAVWAVVQYGFRVVIASWSEKGGTRIPGFADIFRNNAGKNGLLTIELSASDVDRIMGMVQAAPGTTATVDLYDQTIVVHGRDEEVVFPFDVDAGLKERLLGGFDEIDLTLQRKDVIDGFEQRHPTYMPADAQR